MLAEKSLGANVDVNIESKNATLTVQHSLPRNTQENTKTDSIEGGFLSLQEAVWFTIPVVVLAIMPPHCTGSCHPLGIGIELGSTV